MSRVIKFRAWANNKWWHSDDEAYLLKEYDGELWLVEDTQFYLNDNPRYAKIGKAIQFTGLQDCEGKDIYDGDILRQVVWNTVFGNPCREVSWDNDMAQWGISRGREKIPSIHDMEVIGNIHTNPELLEQSP